MVFKRDSRGIYFFFEKGNEQGKITNMLRRGPQKGEEQLKFYTGEKLPARP